VRTRTSLTASQASGRSWGLELAQFRADESPQTTYRAPVSGHRFAGVATFASPLIQRQADEEAAQEPEPPAPAPKKDAKPLDTAAPEPPKQIPVSTDATGTTTVKAPPLVVHDEYGGATLAEVAAALPKEAGSASFDIKAGTQGDPITKATVEVTQEIHLPRWTERDKQCEAVRKAWDAFYDALTLHEDGHVSINQSTFADAHRRYAGKASSSTQLVTDTIKKEAKAAGDEFDEKTKHGLTGKPPTILDLAASCEQAEEEAEGAGTAQAKLEVSQPGDRYELEADRIADQVMRMEDPYGLPRVGIAAGRAGTQRKCAECEAEERKKRVQRKETATGVLVPDRAVSATRSGGQPLDAETRAFMEPRFGFDFSRVRIHADSQAAQAARSINAHAYTIGEDVVFGSGRFSPRAPDGRRLLAHELTHVVQQGGGNAPAGVHASAHVPHRDVQALEARSMRNAIRRKQHKLAT